MVFIKQKLVYKKLFMNQYLYYSNDITLYFSALLLSLKGIMKIAVSTKKIGMWCKKNYISLRTTEFPNSMHTALSSCTKNDNKKTKKNFILLLQALQISINVSRTLIIQFSINQIFWLSKPSCFISPNFTTYNWLQRKVWVHFKPQHFKCNRQ